MTDKLQPLRGMKDLLPEEFAVQDYIINKARIAGELYGYSPMSTPIMEYTKVFDRTLGETSDVISKEMYSFPDKSNNSISLRPEFTAGIIRAFISNGLHHNLPLKFFSHGPVFRYDRPMAARQRQFHQLNFEYIGGAGAYADAETIKLACDIFKALEIEGNVALEVNSLGCLESRNSYQKKLIEYFSNYKGKLSEDSLRRLEKNPMRILDSKDENDQILVLKAPLIEESYSTESKKYFDELLKLLDLMKVKYIINPRLVRGLDYYCHTAFEFTTQKLGTQSTVLAGGRYDGLSKIMGGPDVPAIGFAAGIERLALMREYNITIPRPIFLLPIGDNNLNYSFILADKLRQENIQIILDASGKIGKRMQRANKENAKYAIFIGDEEQISNNFKLKDLDKEEEYSLDFEMMVKIIKN